MSAALKVSNLSFAYRHKEILRDISFELKKGEFLGILGANGSGKTTLFKNLLRFLAPQSGQIELLGKKDLSPEQFANASGFVPQKSHLNTPLKVQEVMLMGKYAQAKKGFFGYPKAFLDEVKEVASRLGLTPLLEREVLSLSGGEFARVMLARALLKRPKILFLDEATSACDLNHAIKLLNLCKQEIQQRQISVVAILHDLNLAAAFCDEVIFLKDAQIAHKGSVSELFKPKILKEIYSFECEVLQSKNQLVVVPQI